jgi:hypothetical protein
MIVAIISSIQFKIDRNRHTVAQAEDGQKIAFPENEANRKFGNYYACIAQDEEAAARKLRPQIQKTVECWNLDPKDFTFKIHTTDVHDGKNSGLFWLIPGTSDGTTYPVAG